MRSGALKELASPAWQATSMNLDFRNPTSRANEVLQGNAMPYVALVNFYFQLTGHTSKRSPISLEDKSNNFKNAVKFSMIQLCAV